MASPVRSSRRRRRSIGFISAAAFAFASATVGTLAPSNVALATSFSVGTTAELRQAISDLNGATPDGVADVITLDNAGPFLLACGTNEDANVDGDLDYSSFDELTITYNGSGRATIAVDQTTPCTTERVIQVIGSGTLNLEHLVIADGNLSDVGGDDADANGGGIASLSGTPTISILDSVIENNRAGNGVNGSVDGGNGGGIHVSTANLTIDGSFIRDNIAGHGGGDTDQATGGSGGGIYAVNGILQITDSVVSTNRAGNGGTGSAIARPGRGGSGGAVNTFGNLIVDDSVIGGATPADGNQAGDAGLLGSWAGSVGNTSSGGHGGGIRMSFRNANLTNVEIANNRAGHALAVDSQTGAPGGSGGGFYGFGTIVFDTVQIHDNAAGSGGPSATGTGGGGGSGGGFHSRGGSTDLLIVDSLIYANRSGDGGASTDGTGGGGGSSGGGIFGGPTFTLDATVVEMNASGAGGDSTNSFGGVGGGAGGLYIGNFTTNQPSGLITDSWIHQNAAGAGGTGSSGPAQPGEAGGLRLNGGATDVLGSTISGNSGARFGGGVYAAATTTHTFVNTTIDGNSASSQGGGIWANSGDFVFDATTFSDNAAMFGSALATLGSVTWTVGRTVFAGNNIGYCNLNGSTGVDAGDNVSQSAAGNSCGVGTLSTDVELSPLDDNGGPTPTRLPGVGGPLVDAISAADCVETVDQRGATRPINTNCDIGAVEIEPSIIANADVLVGIGDELEVDVLDNDVATDALLDPASVNVSTGPSNGSVLVDVSTGVITYTPTGAFAGDDSFTYEVCVVGDPSLCATASASVDITRPDTTPDAFEFDEADGVAISTVQTSNAITVTGINQPASVEVANGEYSVNGGPYTAAAGTVSAGDDIRVRHSSAVTFGALTDSTLTIGGVSAVFSSVTEAGPDPAPMGATRFVPLVPERLFDTRDGTGLPGAGKISAGGVIDIEVAGRLDVPVGAAAVVINLTINQPEAPGFVTAFPRGVATPDSSTLNVTEPGQTRPNLAIVPLDADGYMSAFALMRTHLIGDVAGYYETTAVEVAAGRAVVLPPTRVFDTRPGEPANGPKGFVGPGQSISVQITGEAGVPTTGVAAVIMNVTATQSGGTNFVTVWPTGSERPLASSLNLGAGATTANLVMVPVGVDGQVDFYTLGGTHLLADITGYTTDDTASVDIAGLFVPLTPSRVFDTRPGQSPPGPKGFVPAGESITTQVAGVGDIPSDAAAVVLNVTATQAPAGFITAWPTGQSFPLASTLNLQGASDTRPNAAILPIGDGGRIDYFAVSGAHLLADTTGYYVGAS